MLHAQIACIFLHLSYANVVGCVSFNLVLTACLLGPLVKLSLPLDNG
uniref:Uncharacterized protein n=1 Tax=Rhizophora mucronata TaxID=61149 RepID=A0A2P2QWJ1_RHIMU